MQYRRAAVGLTIAIGLLALLVYGVGWEEVLSTLREANPLFVAGAFLTGGSILIFRAAVINQLLNPLTGRVTGRSFVVTFLSGYFARSALPWGRSTGSPIMAYLFAKNSDSEFEQNLAVVALAELLVFLGSVVVAFVGVITYFGLEEDHGLLAELLGETLSDTNAGLTGLGILIGLTLLAGAIFVTREPGTTRAAVIAGAARADSVLGRLPRVTSPDPLSSRLEGFLSTLETVSAARRTLFVALGIGICSWLINVFPLYFAFLALGVDGSLALALFCAPIATLGGIFPLPGGTGGIETVLIVLLVTLLGVPAEMATAVTLLYRVSTYWLHLTLGGVGALVLSLGGDDPFTI